MTREESGGLGCVGGPGDRGRSCPGVWGEVVGVCEGEEEEYGERKHLDGLAGFGGKCFSQWMLSRGTVDGKEWSFSLLEEELRNKLESHSRWPDFIFTAISSI